MMDHNEQYKGKVVARRYQVHSCFLQERSDIEPLQGCVYACPTNTPTLAPNVCNRNVNRITYARLLSIA